MERADDGGDPASLLSFFAEILHKGPHIYNRIRVILCT